MRIYTANLSRWVSIGVGVLALVIAAGACTTSRRGGSGGDAGGGIDMSTCVGLQCFQVACTNGGATTLTGKVFAPNGVDPVYDALVYVPSTLPDFPTTVQCEACNEPLGGIPIVTTKTDVEGSFTLANVPATMQVPVVVQKGRFRRVITVDVPACTTTPMAKEQTRLPKNKKEGDLPKMAVGVGTYDQIECVLRSIGIDDSEFTAPNGDGSVHLYENGSGTSTNSFGSLLTNYTKMQDYNLMFVNCTNNRATELPTGWKQNMYQYVNSGGRLYVTDWAYDYMEQVSEFAPFVYFEGTGTETTPQPPATAFYASDGSKLTGSLIDPTLATWMKNVGAAPNGTIPIDGSWAIANHMSTDSAKYPAKVWVEGTAPKSTASTLKRPFTATVDYNMCGKILWSSYHTQEPGGSGKSFPGYCASTATTMIPQEKVLEFLIFQISDCVTPVM